MGQISCFSRAASAASPSAPPPPPPCRQLRSTGSDMAAPLNFTSSCWDQKSVNTCSYLLWGWFLRCCMCDQKQNTWVTADLFTKHTDFSSVLWKSSCMDLKPAQDTLCNNLKESQISDHNNIICPQCSCSSPPFVDFWTERNNCIPFDLTGRGTSSVSSYSNSWLKLLNVHTEWMIYVEISISNSNKH